MTEEETEKQIIKKLKWFGELVENLPKPSGESFTDKVVDLEAAKVLTTASQRTMESMAPKPEKSGFEKGVSKGLETVAEEAIKEKFTGKDKISEKVMDVIAETAAESLRDRLSGGGRASEAELELARRDRAEELKGMFQQFTEDVIAPLAEQVKELATKKEEAGGGKMSTDEAVEMVMSAQTRAKKLLEDQGFSVESVNVTKADVKKILEDEEKKFTERLDKEKKDWEDKAGAQVEIEKERIRATEEILTNVTDRVFNIFLEPIRDKIHEAIEKGAFQRRA